jgi:acylphosphatase
MIRKTIHFFGNVQGVGFRYTTRSVVAGFDVVGYVRNLGNGSVELVVEGNETEIERFLEMLRNRMSEHIDREEERESPTTGEFFGFAVR